MNLEDNLRTVPESAPVRVTAAGYLTHECPHKDETDHGSIAITWTCAGATVELHSLSAYLDSFEEVRTSHEAISDCIRTNLAALDGITDVTVVSKWETASLEVRVEAGRS